MGIVLPTKPKITEKEIKELGQLLVNKHDFTDPQRTFVEDVLLRPRVEKSPYEPTPAISKEEAEKLKESLTNRRSEVYQALRDRHIPDPEIEGLIEEIDKALVANR